MGKTTMAMVVFVFLGALSLDLRSLTSAATDLPATILADLPSSDLAGAWADLLSLLDAHKGDSKPAIAKLKSYLIQFGYLPNSTLTSNLSFDDALESAVRLYQQNFQLPVTGSLDSATIAQIVKPRCGGVDVDPDGVSEMLQNHTHSSSSHFVKHYAFFPGSPRWGSKRSLAYYFNQSSLQLASSSSITLQSLRAAFASAFQRWSSVVPLNFTEVARLADADIVISFGSFDHGDRNPFDGPLGILAHAFAPEDGRFHLDASETWSLDSRSSRSPTAVDLESVVVHEIGHLIGLGHSGVSSAIMFPTLAPRQVKTQLEQDDVDGAQALYGANPDYVPGSSFGTNSDVQSSSERLIFSWSSSLFVAAVLGAILLFR